MFDVNAFRQSPGTFMNSFSQAIVGTLSNGLGAGIVVQDNASPTLLNNIVAGLSTGILVDPSSQAAGTVIAGSLYQGNQTGLTDGFGGTPAKTSLIRLPFSAPLFRDSSTRNFYVAAYSEAIDSFDRLLAGSL